MKNSTIIPPISKIEKNTSSTEYRTRLIYNNKINSLKDFIFLGAVIEVFFKEAKQHIGLCKCQSRDFDAQISKIDTNNIDEKSA